MKFRIIVLTLLAAIVIFPVFAHEAITQHVQFNNFSFAYDTALANHVTITEQAASSDSFPPSPASVRYEVYDPTNAGIDFGPQVTMWVYDTADMAAYPEYEKNLEQLQALLKDRPNLAQYTEPVEGLTGNALPFVPVIAEGQTIRAAARYIETDTVVGIRYITAYQAAVEPLSDSILFYAFQGISKDGKHMVSVMAWLSNSVFPKNEDMTGADVEAFRAQGLDYWKDAVDRIERAEIGAYTPSLPGLDELVNSIEFLQ